MNFLVFVLGIVFVLSFSVAIFSIKHLYGLIIDIFIYKSEEEQTFQTAVLLILVFTIATVICLLDFMGIYLLV